MHLVQRGNNRQQVFPDDEARRCFLLLALRFAEKRDVEVHAYVLMPNHVHLLAGAQATGAISSFMHDLGLTFVQWHNERYGRTGTLWEGRFRSCLVDSNRYLWNCHRYIEFNPVRACLCANPEDWDWSSYRANAFGLPDPLVRPRPEYAALAPAAQDRPALYRQHVAMAAADEEFATRRLRGFSTLGGTEFDEETSRRLGRVLEPMPRGRPRQRAGVDQESLV
jgi:putative transposase